MATRTSPTKSSTKFGKELQKIRVDSSETRKEMASRLGLVERELTNIEYGKTAITSELVSKVLDTYFDNMLDRTNAERVLFEAQKQSTNSIVFDMTALNDEQRTAVLELSNRIEGERQAEIKAKREEEKRIRQEKAKARAERKKVTEQIAEEVPKAEQATESTEEVDDEMAAAMAELGLS